MVTSTGLLRLGKGSRRRVRVPEDERSVAPAVVEELVVGSDLDHSTMIEYDDLVCVADGRESVGDGERRPALSEALERVLHGPLGLRVERRRGLVKNEDGRVAENRPRDREALLLAAGEAVAALTDNGVVTLRQRALVLNSMPACAP